MKNQSYYNEQKIKNTERLRKILKEFPDFALDFFTGIENKTSALTGSIMPMTFELFLIGL